MRIISGKYKGRRINPPKKLPVRPTTDMAKEALFNILNNLYYFDDISVLDLFAGTGSISYEFASRGARSVLAIEMAPLHFKFIQESCRNMDLDQVTVLRADAFRFLKKPIQSFDIIFADPPYDHPGLEELPDLVLGTNILNKPGVFILEHPGNHSFTAHPRFQQLRKYGGVSFSFFS